MGRDLSVLYQWQQTGKPPLLGPQTSVLPINQSALYYYLLYPFYLLTNQSSLTALYANSFVYLTVFIFLFIKQKNNPRLQIPLLLIFYLISIQPQYILQGRFIWNPSFVTPFLLLSLFSFKSLITKFTKKSLWLLTLPLALAFSFSYSVTPVIIAIFLGLLIYRKSLLLPVIFSFIISVIIINLPTILFDLRHHFILLTGLFTKTPPVQQLLNPVTKIYMLSDYIFNLKNQTINLILILLTVIILFKKSLIFLILLGTIVITILAPITLQPHYIFGILTLFFFRIALLPLKISALFILFLSFIYLQPTNILAYFSTAPRTYNQMLTCYQQFCRRITIPIFVSSQSNLNPFHNGPEHRYLLKKAGCDIKEIEADQSAASLMVVVGDGSDYEHGKTHYYELTLFGQSKLESTTKCQDNFKLYLLKKI